MTPELQAKADAAWEECTKGVPLLWADDHLRSTFNLGYIAGSRDAMGQAQKICMESIQETAT